jgi:hypothetical protein
LRLETPEETPNDDHIFRPQGAARHCHRSLHGHRLRHRRTTAHERELQSARGELAAATPNKGGHRERAMGLIDQAIGEVRAGIAFAGG